MRKFFTFIVTLVMLICLVGCILGSRAEAAPDDGFYSGVLREGQDEGGKFYFTDVGEAQYEKLVEALAGVYEESGDYEVRSEIHLYTTDKNINLKDNVGKEISFKGDFFEAHTIHHRRDIVFEIKEMF